jgi:hypothetical protein
MSTFYHQVIKSCEPYLGNGTKRFVNRQIIYHLSKTPETVDYSDKEELTQWIRVSAALVLGPDKATELAARILALPNENSL